MATWTFWEAKNKIINLENNMAFKTSQTETKEKPIERKISTSYFDFAIADLVRKIEEKDIVIPHMQRNYVWNSGGNEIKASRLIESLILGMPIPNFYFAETETLVYDVIDGQQRLTSCKRFMDNEFLLEGLEIMTELNGKRHSELEQIDRDKLKKRGVRAIVIGNESSPQVKFDIFERLNTGSMSLSSQDVRHAIYDGNFNKLIIDLANLVKSSGKFHFSRELDNDIRSAEELVLRFFAFYAQGEANFGKESSQLLKVFLNKFMEINRDLSESDIIFYRQLFIDTFNTVTSYLDTPFNKKSKEEAKTSKKAEPKSNRGIFDMIMLAFACESKNIKNGEVVSKSVFKKEYESWLKNNNLDFSHTDSKNLVARVNKIRDILTNSSLIQ